MIKFINFCTIIAIILMILFTIYKTNNITLNIPVKGLVSEDVLFEDELEEITDKYGDFFENYALSNIRYTRDDHMGHVIYSCTKKNNYSIISLEVDNDVFTVARKYRNNSRFANLFWRPPIDLDELNINSKELFEIIHDNDSSFETSRIRELLLNEHRYWDCLAWECEYETNDDHLISVNATTGEILESEPRVKNKN